MQTSVQKIDKDAIMHLCSIHARFAAKDIKFLLELMLEATTNLAQVK